MDMLVPAAIGALVAVVVVAKSVVVVPRGRAYVVERLGRYARTLGPGLPVLMPALDAVRHRHDLAEQSRPIGPVTCITLDNQPVAVAGTLHLAITDARAATYGAADATGACEALACTAIRDEIGRRSLEEVRDGRGSLGRQVSERVASAAAGWGITIRACEIDAVGPAR